MGLFGITLKKLESIPSDLWHDAFGGGQPAPQNGGQPQGGRGPVQLSAPSFGQAPQQQQNPATSPALMPPPQQQNKKPGVIYDAFHNPVTDFVGKDIVKPLVSAPLQFGKEALAVPGAIGREIQNKPITDIQQQTFGTTDPMRIGEKIAGSTIGTGLTVAAPGIEGALAGTVPKLAVDAGIGTGFGASSAAASGGNLKQVAEGAATGGVGAGALGAAARVAAPAFRAAGQEILDHIRTSPDENPFMAPTQAPKTTAAATQTAPKAFNITPKADSSLKVSNALPENTASAAHTLSALYNEDPEKAMNAHNLINMAIGRSRRFSKAGDQFEQAIGQDFTPEEAQAARDTLEGVATSPTAKVKALSDTMKQLNEQGYNVLDNASTAENPLHRVANYATRATDTGANPNTVAGNSVKKVASSIQDIFNARSGFANNRVVQKFVSSDGKTKFGTQTELGLTKKGSSLVDKNGVKYTPKATSTTELNENGYNYKDLNAATNQYHSSVGRVKTAQDAKAELLRDPEAYGLTKTPPASDALGKYVPVKGIPELDGYYAARQDAKDISDTFDHPYVPSVPERVFQGVSTGAIQSIVYNPLFHTRNLNELAGLAAGKVKGITGGIQYKKALYDWATMSPEERASVVDRMDAKGVVKETYGADRQTVVSQAMDAAGLPHINKISPTVMGNIDWGMRGALFHLVTTGDGAIGDEQAAALVNRFMGDRTNSGVLSRNFGLFWHYMKTRVNIVSDAIKHPNENQGAIMMAAVQAATIYGATKAFQEWTGNKHASLGNPGIFGLVKKGEEVAHGQGIAAATSSINPVVTAVANQAYSKDLYTGRDIKGNKARLANAAQTLIAPLQNTSRVADGKSSKAQAALQMSLGVNLPHVKGAPAVPNQNNPFASTINTKDAKPVADEKNAQGKVVTHDPTGLDQAKVYYDAKNKALGAVQGSPEATDIVNAYLDSNTTPGGDKMKKSPAQAMGVAEMLSGSPDAMAAMKKLQLAQPSHDPIWDLSDKDLRTFLQAEGSSSSSGVKEADKIIHTDFNNGQGFDQFLKQRDAYYSNNKFESTSKDNPETPNFPSFQGQQQADYNTYKAQFQNATGQQKAQFLQAHPLAADAVKQVGDYYNALNKAQTGLMTKDSMQLSPAQQTWFNWYNSLPKGSGARSQAIKGDPAMWKSISGALAENDLTNLAKEGAVNQYQGVPFQQDFLKNALNAGKYDIQSNVPLPGGGTGYAVNTTGASSGGGGKGGKGSAKASATLSKVLAGEKAASQARDAEHAAKAARRAVNPRFEPRAPRRLSVKIKGTPTGKPPRAKQAGVGKVYIPSIKLRSPSNKATLKVR